MIGGFGTVRVAKLHENIMAVKEIRITGDRDDRTRFAIVRRQLQLRDSGWTIHVSFRRDLHGSSGFGLPLTIRTSSSYPGITWTLECPSLSLSARSTPTGISENISKLRSPIMTRD